MTHDLDDAARRVIDKLRREFPISPREETEPWDEPPLNVLDCVLSLNRKYDQFCLPRVQNFKDQHPEIITLESLLKLIETYPTPLDFSAKELNYHDERRAATLVGVLKALLQVQEHFEGSDDASRLKAWADSVKPADYENFGVPGFGLSGFQYLRMLFGAQTIKPDVHIRRFVSDAVGREVADETAITLMEAAGKRLQWPLSSLDYIVWRRGATGIKKKRDAAEAVLEVGSEGGSLTLIRERNGEAGWQFRMGRDESAIYDLLSQEDRSELADYSGQTQCVNSFEDALKFLDQYPWFRLHPVYVHPEFITAVLFQVEKRGGAQEAARWREQLKQSDAHDLSSDRYPAPMVDVKAAVANAIDFAKASLGAERTVSIRLEEVDSSNVGGREVWLITLSNSQIDEGPLAAHRATAAVLGADLRREYKVFAVAKDNGEVLSMKIRLLQTPIAS